MIKTATIHVTLIDDTDKKRTYVLAEADENDGFTRQELDEITGQIHANVLVDYTEKRHAENKETHISFKH